ncbi:MAG TPA: hypothetical protein VER03_26485 [Bryobacteraceae bacterium]|nr:hypothetical protein [Bryobacteraceae bacterium]
MSQSAYAFSDHPQVRRTRDRLNNWPIAIAGILWLLPMSGFWTRFIPALRPFDFDAPFPPLGIFLGGIALCCAPLLLPESYYRPKGFERGRLYPSLGLRLFRRWAPDGDFINRRLRAIDPDYRAVRSRAALKEHIRSTHSNERAHLVLLLAGLLTAVFALALNELTRAALLIPGNIAFNLYPVMHQRYKRARLRRS